MLQLRKNQTHCKKLPWKNRSPSHGSTRILWLNDRRRKRRNETTTGFCQKLTEDSPPLLVPEQCTYRSIVPSEYLSLNSIIYEIKDREGKIRNTSIRDKENKFKNNSAPWMLRQLWKYPDQGITQLKTFVHGTQYQNVNEVLCYEHVTRHQ